MKQANVQAPARRRFLKQVMAVGGGSALVLFSVARDDAPVIHSGNGGEVTPAGQGYRLTDHIRAYYESTRS